MWACSDVTVLVLDRPRHKEIIQECRQAGARIRLISDGDVGGAIEVAKAGTPVDMLVGIGGTPEGEYQIEQTAAIFRHLSKHSSSNGASPLHAGCWLMLGPQGLLSKQAHCPRCSCWCSNQLLASCAGVIAAAALKCMGGSMQVRPTEGLQVLCDVRPASLVSPAGAPVAQVRRRKEGSRGGWLQD